MKKALLGILIIFEFSGQLYSQSTNPTLMLTEVMSDDGYEYEKYFYNSNLLLDEKEVLYSDGVEAKEVFQYEGEKVIKTEGYQLINGEWKNTYYIDYNYDSNGNRTSRANYNNFGGEDFELGGIYEYQYENNRRTGWTLTMMDMLIEQGQLIYDENGRLMEEVAQDSWATGQMEDSWKVTYTYNADGSLDKAQQSYWDEIEWQDLFSDNFFYDENGNCIKWEHLSGGAVTNRFDYEYDMNYDSDDLVLPYSPEDDADPFRWVEKPNKLDISHWYTLNDDGQLMYICDFIYLYSPVGDLGINNMHLADGGIMVYPNPTADWLNITSDCGPIQNISIVDMSGKVIMTKNSINKNDVQLDVSHLTPGVYVVQSRTAGGVKSRKIVLK